MSVFPLFLFCIKQLTKPVDFDDSFNRIPFFRIRKQRRKENFRLPTLCTISFFLNRLREYIIRTNCIDDIFAVFQKILLFF